MKRFILVIPLLAAVIASPTQMKASPMPCSAVLEPVNQKLKNAKGAALIYKCSYTRQVLQERIWVFLLSTFLSHLLMEATTVMKDLPPKQGRSVGDLNYIRLPRKSESPNWAGRVDSISAEMTNVKVQVRLSNSKTQKLGPSVLTNNIQSCY